MQMGTIAIGLTTVAGRCDADALAGDAVRQGLVACAQIEGPLQSMYMWGGDVVADEEFRLVFKFASAKRAELEAWLDQRHPYELPQWVVLDPCSASAAYAKWVNG